MKLALALLCLVLVAVAALPSRAAVPFDPFAATDVESPENAAVPRGARFTDRHGRAVDLGDLVRGDVPVILAPVYFTCPNICSVSTASLVQSLGLLTTLDHGRDYRVVFFSFDPRETPADARDALRAVSERRYDYAPLPRLSWLTGGADAIRKVTDALGYRYGWDDSIQQYSHANAFAVLTPDGRLSRWINAIAVEPTDLRLAITEAGAGKVGSVSDFLLMLCYHYDPTTGKYGSLINVSIKGLAAVTLACLFGFIGYALWQEKRRDRQREGP